MLTIGSKAPIFKLKLDNGKNFRLQDYIGKRNVLISFFPDGLSNTETQETFAFLQHLQKLQNLGAVVLAICPKNIYELRNLLSIYNFPLPIASDPTLEVCRNYHAFWLRGLGLRKITYMIDKKGIIRCRLNHHLLTEKSWEPVIRLLSELDGSTTG
jgi:thioredoxin-dependent peroxiredoxin